MVIGGGGVREALTHLALPEDDWLIGAAILEEAQRIQVSRLTDQIKATASLTGVKVAEVLAQMFR